MKKEQLICQCGKKASKSCANRSCFNCCKIIQRRERAIDSECGDRAIGAEDKAIHKCKYHDIYMKARKKYSANAANIIMNHTTPSVDKIRKKRRRGKKITIKIERSNREDPNESRIKEITRELEARIRDAIGVSFANYRAKINIKL